MSAIEVKLVKGALRVSSIYQGEERKKTFYRPSITLGRAGANSQPDFDLSPDNNISRNHARIWIEDGACWIEDLGTKFGTRVDAKEIRGLGKVRIDAASRIELGDTVIKVETHTDSPSGFAALDPQAASSATIEFERAISTNRIRLSRPESSGLDVAQRQALLLEILIHFTLPGSLEQLLQTIIGRIVELVPGAVRGTLLLLEPKTDKLLLAAYVSSDEPAVSETLARRALQKQQGFVWRNRFGTDHALSIHRHQIQSGMYAPLIYDGRPLGVLCVDNPDCQSAFSEENLQLLVAVADHAAVAVSYSQMRQELREKSALLEAALSNLSPSVRTRLIEEARRKS
jgi:pSer/pThr/pTyr-binding forkhead associated (FHA) protein